MSIKSSLNNLKSRIYNEAHSSRGRNIMLYLLFVCVAFVFWLLLSLDSEVQRDYDVPLTVENVPDSVTFISLPPTTINVGVTAKGSQLLQYSWGKIPALKLNYSEYVAGSHSWAINSTKLESKVRDYFGNSIIINSVRPDSIRLETTSLPGELMPVIIDAQVSPNIQCIISGPITVDTDSVMVYSARPIPRSFKVVTTEEIVRRDLKDTTYVEIGLVSVEGLRFIPDRVRVTIPVEPLISKRQTVRISSVNVPEGSNIITFPSEVTVSYLVPMSRYNDEYPLKTIVDYNDVTPGGIMIPVRISLLPEYMRDLSLSPDSVEYVIERHEP